MTASSCPDRKTSARGSIPAIALTAYASTEDRERVMAAGFQKYLAKPIDLPELVAAIVMLTDDPSSDLNSSDPTRTARAA